MRMTRVPQERPGAVQGRLFGGSRSRPEGMSGFTCGGVIVGSATPGHQPFAPVDGLPFVDGLRGVEEAVQHVVQVLGTGIVGAVGVDVRGRGALAFGHQHFRLEIGS